VVDDEIDEAIEQVHEGRNELCAALRQVGMDDQQIDDDPGVQYLIELERQIRQQYGVDYTLRERLDAAIESEDFESAASIRDELRRRRHRGHRHLPAPPDSRDRSNRPAD
jgi:hypothetical protein